MRKVEKTVKALLAAPAPSHESEAQPIDMQTRWLERQLARELGENVAIRRGPDGYVLQLGFADLAKLETSLQRLQELVRQIRAVAGPRARENAS